jgi:uncharacterized iron-regulated membrane protein
MTRQFWVLIHRYAGLYMAVFLIVAGLTGTILAFEREINRWLIPEMSHVPVRDRPQLDPLTLRERAQAIFLHARFNFVDMNTDPGDVVYFAPEPRTDPATGKPYDLDCAELYLNPYTGEETARVNKQDEVTWPVTRRNFTRFVFEIHSKLYGGQIGEFLFGIAALIWTFDCFVGFYLTLPASSGPFWKRWGHAWWVKWRANAFRINFDLHRAAGLWTWALLFVFAISSVGFNLPQVYLPVMKHVFHMPDVQSNLPHLAQPVHDPVLGWREAYVIGEQLAAQQASLHGFKLKQARGATYFIYDPNSGTFSYSAHGERDVGFHFPAVTVFFDGKTGELKGRTFASGESAAITFTNWVNAIHTLTVGGMTTQIGVGVMGIVIAMLSITGVYIWWKKHKGRILAASRHHLTESKGSNS